MCPPDSPPPTSGLARTPLEAAPPLPPPCSCRHLVQRLLCLLPRAQQAQRRHGRAGSWSSCRLQQWGCDARVCILTSAATCAWLLGPQGPRTQHWQHPVQAARHPVRHSSAPSQAAPTCDLAQPSGDRCTLVNVCKQGCHGVAAAACRCWRPRCSASCRRWLAFLQQRAWRRRRGRRRGAARLLACCSCCCWHRWRCCRCAAACCCCPRLELGHWNAGGIPGRPSWEVSRAEGLQAGGQATQTCQHRHGLEQNTQDHRQVAHTKNKLPQRGPGEAPERIGSHSVP